MKIENIETFLVNIPFDHGAQQRKLTGREWPCLEYVFVRIDTDEGISGWGDAFGYGAALATKAAVDHIVAPNLIGEDASDIAGLSYKMQQQNHLWGRYGITMFAISGIDIALWDLAGKAQGKSVTALLGGAKRTVLPGYASLFKYEDRDLVAAKTDQAIDEGFRHVKLHETAESEVAAAREVGGRDLAIMLDTNCPWTPAQAAEMAAALKQYELFWLEEPIFPPEDFKALAKLQRSSGIPLAAGENACTALEFEKMFDAGAVTYAQPSVTKVGGITEMMKILPLAKAVGVSVVPHCPYFGCGFLASLHIAAAMEEDCLIERFYLDLEAAPIPGFIYPQDGKFAIPTEPGLGLDPDMNVLRDYAG